MECIVPRKGTGLGEKNSQFGTLWITKDGLNKKIKKRRVRKLSK